MFASLRLLLVSLSLLLTGCADDRGDAPAVASAAGSALVLHHQLRVVPDMQSGVLSVEDSIRFSGSAASMPPEFALGEVFTVQGENSADWSSLRTQDGMKLYALAGNDSLTLKYQGKLITTPDCAWLTQACVQFGAEGIYLDGKSGWYADVKGALHTFELEVQLPAGWVSLSQGQQTAQGWQEQQPQTSLYLLAGAFKVYSEPGANATALVYLRSADDELAKRYLRATHQYVEEYSRLLGNYPYAKFATVESFWETGWGMPSFTLLGSKVMRLPFILSSSFPHEILHNWWGNGVYVDAGEGNWSEGLTAYLADYRISEGKGEGMPYRRDALQKYVAFAGNGGDFPLQEFRSRHDQTTQAVGYGKSLMLFHALRQRLGGDLFISGLRQLYRDHAFQPITFGGVRAVFERVSGQDLQGFFSQWLTRTGAPTLAVDGQRLDQNAQGKVVLAFTLRQQSQGANPDQPFQMQVPLVATFADGHTQTDVLEYSQASQPFQFEYAEAPVQVAVDPGFDVFRIPTMAEVPPALNVLLSRQPKAFVLSRKVPPGMELAWDELVDALSFGQGNMKKQYDDEPLPDSGIVVLLGGDNAALSGLLERARQPFTLNDAAYTLNSVSYTCGLHSLALALHAGQQQLVLLDASTPEALQQLANKVPHYGKYSYVLFNSATGENVAKGQWDVTDSPLVMQFAE